MYLFRKGNDGKKPAVLFATELIIWIFSLHNKKPFVFFRLDEQGRTLRILNTSSFAIYVHYTKCNSYITSLCIAIFENISTFDTFVPQFCYPLIINNLIFFWLNHKWEDFQFRTIRPSNTFCKCNKDANNNINNR